MVKMTELDSLKSTLFKEKLTSELILPPILVPYLLVTPITCHRDSQGYHYVDELWYKDLLEHVNYLKNLILASPCKEADPTDGMICLEKDSRFSSTRFLDLPAPENFVQSLYYIPANIVQLWSAIRKVKIVHSSVAGWPIPPAWFTSPLSRLCGRFNLIIVESAFWRLDPGRKHSLTTRLRSIVSEQLNRWCINQTNLAIFSQPEWRSSLLTNPKTKSLIIHCSWINAENILSDEAAIKLWQAKLTLEDKKLRIILAGRLETFKGVRVILEAMKMIDQENLPVRLDILGQGSLYDECLKASQELRGTTEINVLGTVPYGPKLFKLLGSYHALVLPTLSDEPVRIVYDAYSQGLPVLASNTNGLLECIKPNQTGKHYQSNDPVALSEVLKWSLNNFDQLQIMGMNALNTARSLTHQEMHRKRWEVLQDMLT